jgi:hypothetical protein
MDDPARTRNAVATALQDLQSGEGVQAAVSGGAAVLPPENGAPRFAPEQLRNAADALGIGSLPAPAEGGDVQSLSWNTGTIAFSGGVPVGGWANLLLFPDGTAQFTGHFHVSGAPSYNTALAWAVKAGDGFVFTFAHAGRVHGTFESGSRDDDWNEVRHSDDLRNHFNALSASWNQRWSAHVNLNIGAVVDDVKTAVGVAAAVIAIV